jgi:hypothetical protein
MAIVYEIARANNRGGHLAQTEKETSSTQHRIHMTILGNSHQKEMISKFFEN